MREGQEEAQEVMSVNLVSQPAAAGKLATPWLRRRVLRSLTLTPLLALVVALTALPAAAQAEGCPDEQARSERGSTSLPDCRAYEMVTPPQKNGAVIGETYINIFPSRALVAANGERVIAASIQCFAEAQSCVGFRRSEGAPFAFTRTAGGWVTTPLMPPAASFETSTYWSLNADAGTALFTAPTPPHSSVEDLYALSEHGSPLAIGPDGDPKVIVGRLAFEVFGQGTLLSTADLSHVVYQTNSPAWGFDATGQSSSVYEYVGTGNAAPLLVGVSGPKGSEAVISTCGAETGGHLVNHEALSADGRTVYFTALGHDRGGEACPVTATAAPVSELYARIDGERADARSALISAPTPGVCISKECEENTGKAKEAERFRDASYEGASTDGSRVFFTSTQQLTDGASQSSGGVPGNLHCNTLGGPGDGGCNLYESECEGCEELGESEEHSRRRLIDISEGASEHGGPRVQGVMASSADGSHVYFVAKAKLTGEEENQNHETAQEEADNLYVYERDRAFPQGRLAFVTTLSPSDEGEWEPNALLANVTPDGRFLAFTSHRALTADDTRAEGPAQVFEYDAQSKRLIRVSIGEGAFNDNGNAGTGNASIASQVVALTVPMRNDTTMSDNGAFVFFQSPVALAAGALNDVVINQEFGEYAQNVYEYHEGHVSLISDGKDTTPESKAPASSVELLGSDTSGSNVFFTTFDPLVPEDTDTQRDFYDAHVCSAELPCPPPKPAPPPGCEGEACQGPSGAPPVFGAPSSSTFSGPGNLVIPPPAASGSRQTAAQAKAAKLARALKACHAKKNKRKRATCEKQAKKLYGSAKTAKRPSGK
jgi:hypothetical protein